MPIYTFEALDYTIAKIEATNFNSQRILERDIQNAVKRKTSINAGSQK